ncbi:early nodulin-93-like protein [Carex littledalei]|uniref:Early nodulin-93-like protein n=1 Tax=Carex littledalei TaxID=544730 RepID=A0A833QJ14_9POAL|nr:early nodulin-93-like protein [Carex littledalei]
MGIPTELRDAWVNKRQSYTNTTMMAASPIEKSILDSDNSIREAVQSGFKAALVSGVAAAVPTVIFSSLKPSVAGFFIAADKYILENARENSIGKQVRNL